MNPYKLPNDEYVLISFSGGRSSAYMLHQLIKTNSGLPDKTVVAFANTGREMPQTLDFVHECGRRWGVDIVWLEHNYKGKKSIVEPVNYETASRDGEPFERLIKRRRFLPNVATRFCTQELKIRTMQRYMRQWCGAQSYLNYIGIRADEPRRVAKVRALNETENFRPAVIPMAEEGVTKECIGRFWNAMPFDLELPNINGTTPLGNCDLCFLKGVKRLSSLVRDYPERAQWWMRQEDRALKEGARRENASFIKFIPYKELPGWTNENLFDDSIECIGCTD